ncbi:MAG: tetratricopeptide repeat protein [Tepidisphaeraceae bacterium]
MSATSRDNALVQIRRMITSGAMADARLACQRLLDEQPGDADAMHLLGMIEHRRGDHAAAVVTIQRSIQIGGADAAKLNNLGSAQRGLGEMTGAIASFRSAVEMKPDHFEAWSNLGVALLENGDFESAIDACRRAIAIRPREPKPYNRLGVALRQDYRPGEAVEVLQAALRQNPAYLPARQNLGGSLLDLGEVEQAIECFRQVIAAPGGNPAAHSNLLYSLHYRDVLSASEMLDAHREFDQLYARALTASAPGFANDRNPERLLRIGYVSAHLRNHAVAVFAEPLIAAHDRASFEVYCYSTASRPDYVSDRIAAKVNWRDASRLGDEALCERIRDDRIDVLVDLIGHIEGSRLTTFARRAAPVQITYLGYQDTTGLSAMDWRLTDAIADAPELGTDAHHTERLLRLPHAFFAYRPWDEAPPVAPSPFEKCGHVTFASFNNFAKISPRCVSMWAGVLRAVPDSNLIILTRSRMPCQTPVHSWFESEQVAPDRIRWLPPTSNADYLAGFASADVMLDTAPFSGHTTTCDSLWMGVPVVTLAGANYASRMSTSVLHNAGLPRLIARNDAEYVEISASLARDREALAELRRTLREKLRNSVILDARSFARDVETAFRAAWREWCASTA